MSESLHVTMWSRPRVISLNEIRRVALTPSRRACAWFFLVMRVLFSPSGSTQSMSLFLPRASPVIALFQYRLLSFR